MSLDLLTVGTVNVDHIAANLGELPMPGVTQFTGERIIERPASGHPANVAIDAVKLGVNAGRIGIVAALGKDVAGRASMAELKRYGIRRFIQWTSSPTGKNLILVPRGYDRIFTIDPGANFDLSPVHVRKILQAHWPKVLSIRPGYSGIDDDIASILEGLRGTTFILLDLIRPYRKPWDYLYPILPFVDAIHGNEQEIIGLADVSEIRDAIPKLHGLGVEVVLVTRGHQGAFLSTPKLCMTQPGFVVNAVDPTGCGDAFCAGFLVNILRKGKSRDFIQDELCDMLMYAQAVGASAACGIGCTSGVDGEFVARLLIRQGKRLRTEMSLI